jgi:hypothetical protein
METNDVTVQIRHLCVALVLLLATVSPVSAAVHFFDLNGNAGLGLLSGNENGAILGTPGSGGEVGAGITYDDDTNILNINIAWGSSNGFTNLTGDASAGHIHGPTTNSAPVGFTQDAGVLLFLSPPSPAGSTWTPSASAGGFTGNLTLSAGQETELLAQRYYINIHTSLNGGGEIRGHLVIGIPEPTTFALVGLTVFGLGFIRRRRSG